MIPGSGSGGESGNSLRSRVWALPKAHLHLHLFGGISRGLLSEACHRQQLPPIIFPKTYSSFDAFDELYGHVVDIVRGSLLLEEIIQDHLQQAEQDGVVWTEIAVSPREPAFLRMILELIQPYRDRLGIMLLGDRHRPEQIDDMARLAIRHAPTGIVAFGLAGAEHASPLVNFTSGFKLARDAGLIISPHAGEITGADDIWQAVRHLRPHRIAHGVWAKHDPLLIEHLAQADICLDLCPLSNVSIGGWNLLDYPLRSFLQQGVPCSINADDPLFLGTSLLDEFEIASKTLGLTTQQLADLAWNSIRYSAAPQGVKEEAYDKINTWRLQGAIPEQQAVATA